jgi:ectoine hydroxylase-related dioxygenase (phytanoyl-CoA dioxygenase family)
MFNSMEWTVPVEDLDIIIFPSTLFHYVKPNTSNRDRISIAFNTFARGHIKTESTGADLILN